MEVENIFSIFTRGLIKCGFTFAPAGLAFSQPATLFAAVGGVGTGRLRLLSAISCFTTAGWGVCSGRNNNPVLFVADQDLIPYRCILARISDFYPSSIFSHKAEGNRKGVWECDYLFYDYH